MCLIKSTNFCLVRDMLLLFLEKFTDSCLRGIQISKKLIAKLGDRERERQRERGKGGNLECSTN